MFYELLNNQIYFFAFFAFNVLWMLMFLYWGRRRVNAIFQGMENSNVIFREKRASGYSKKSIITRIGGARNVLDIIVTDADLCVKRIFLPFSVIGLSYDLTLRIKLSEIVGVTRKGEKVEVAFENDKGARSIVLKLKNTDAFIHATEG